MALPNEKLRSKLVAENEKTKCSEKQTVKRWFAILKSLLSNENTKHYSRRRRNRGVVVVVVVVARRARRAAARRRNDRQVLLRRLMLAQAASLRERQIADVAVKATRVGVVRLNVSIEDALRRVHLVAVDAPQRPQHVVHGINVMVEMMFL